MKLLFVITLMALAAGSAVSVPSAPAMALGVGSR